MASHCYAMPIIFVTYTRGGGRYIPPSTVQLAYPKYVDSVGVETWGMLPYDDPAVGVKGCIIAAVVTPEQDAALRAFNDVVATPLPGNASTPMKNAAAAVLALAHQTTDFSDAT